MKGGVMVTKRTLSKNILFLEMLGFILMIAVIWANELLDVPHKAFGAPATPVNWYECAVESIGMLILGVVIIICSWRTLARIRFLEGIMNMCSYCKRIRLGDQWVCVDRYVMDHSEALISHGLCPECLKKHYPGVDIKKKTSRSES